MMVMRRIDWHYVSDIKEHMNEKLYLLFEEE